MQTKKGNFLHTQNNTKLYSFGSNRQIFCYFFVTLFTQNKKHFFRYFIVNFTLVKNVDRTFYWKYVCTQCEKFCNWKANIITMVWKRRCHVIHRTLENTASHLILCYIYPYSVYKIYDGMYSIYSICTFSFCFGWYSSACVSVCGWRLKNLYYVKYGKCPIPYNEMKCILVDGNTYQYTEYGYYCIQSQHSHVYDFTQNTGTTTISPSVPFMSSIMPCLYTQHTSCIAYVIFSQMYITIAIELKLYKYKKRILHIFSICRM